MSYFSRDLNMVFIHIPKNAGTSIHRTLTDLVPDLEAFDATDALHREQRHPAFANHFPMPMANALCRYFIPDFDPLKATSFMVVRNPWERMVSLFEHRKRKKDLFYEGNPRNSGPDKVALAKGFKYWLMESPSPGDSILTRTPQMDWGPVTHTLNFNDDLLGQWVDLIHGLGLPTVNLVQANTGKGESSKYRSYYDIESFGFVRDRFKKDIEEFNYAF